MIGIHDFFETVEFQVFISCSNHASLNQDQSFVQYSLNHLDKMEAQLAQLEPVLLRYMNVDLEVQQHGRNFSFLGLHERLPRDCSKAPSVEKAEETSESTLTGGDAALEPPDQERPGSIACGQDSCPNNSEQHVRVLKHG